MATILTSNDFIVWGLDHVAYGPVELPTVVNWVKDERVLADTWVFTCKTGKWQQAGEIPELNMFFGRSRGQSAESTGALNGRQLRRIKILATLTDEHLTLFARHCELERVPQWSVVVTQGDQGDSMYFVLEGELRVRVNVIGKETILAALGPGDFFGDLVVFDQGPRAADVVANTDSTLVKLSSKSLDRIGKESPEAAAEFLKAVGRTLTARIRADNKRHVDSVAFNRASA